MQPETWNYLNHNAPQTAVLLPGWATDWRIWSIGGKTGTGSYFPGDSTSNELRFSENRCLSPFFLSAEMNIITPAGLLTGGIDDLADFLHECACGPVSLFGWSLGGFAAAEFAAAHPELVASMTLAGVRRKYPPEQVAARREGLLADRRSCLKDFYRQCFLPAQKEDYRIFRRELEEQYLTDFSEADLLAGLDYLERCELKPESMPKCPITFLHGARDVIAPAEEAAALAAETGAPFHLIQGGHAFIWSAAWSAAFEG